MRATIYIANITTANAARIAQERDLSGTVYAALGFGAWGVEPTTVVVFGDIAPDVLAGFLAHVFGFTNEEAVYAELDDAPGVTLYWTRDIRANILSTIGA